MVPVYNEVGTIEKVVNEIIGYRSKDDKFILVNDGSNDGTEAIFEAWEEEGFFERHNITAISQPQNSGYGGALVAAFDKALEDPEPQYVLTMDCDLQHQPRDIPRFFGAPHVEILSASRYLNAGSAGIEAPPDRVAINRKISEELIARAKEELGEEWPLSDAFCGMKRYSRSFISAFLEFSETLDGPSRELLFGYGFPLPLWTFFLRLVKREKRSLLESFAEIAIERIYVTDDRSFGEALDQPERRYQYYQDCLKVG